MTTSAPAHPVQLVLAEDAGHAARHLYLNRSASANALSADLVDALHDELDRAESEGIRTVVLRGTHRHFSAGLDLAGLADETDATLVHRFVRLGLLLERLAGAPYVTVAVVQGSAVGAGADIAAACDHRLGTPEASLRFPGSAFGVVLGVARLSTLVGPSRAARLVSGGSVVPAMEAHRMGLLTEIHDPGDLEAAVAAIAAESARPPTDTLRALIGATRPTPDPSALADLVRSVALRPGLRSRVEGFVEARRTASPRMREIR